MLPRFKTPSSFVLLTCSLACGAASDGLYENGAEGFVDDSSPSDGALAPIIFPGAGTSGAAEPLSPGLGPESSDECNPTPSAALPSSADSVQSVCFYTEDDPTTPAATIEQVVEVVGNTEWVHVRLILSPTFADNSYGSTAIGWSEGDVIVSDAPPPPAPMAGPAPMDRADRAPRERAPKPAKGAHAFRDLVGSDHAEIQILDASGAVAVHFKLDYLSESTTAPSGYASLGVTGGEGKMLAGDPAWIIGSSTSIDRNLNACGLSAFVEDSPGADDSYVPSGDATDWDYRVIYEVWISTEAFGSAEFGSALIESVHASPSKTGENTEIVTPAPCPSNPGEPDWTPELPPVLTEIR